MGTKLVTNRNITVTGKSGSSIKFVKGVPTHVPDQAIEDCMAAGAIPAPGERVAAHKPEPDIVDAPQGVERKQRILDAIDQMVVLNERGTFNANGAPKQPQLEKAAGFVIDTREIETLWHEYDAARKQDTIVDLDAVATVKDAAPVVIEHDDEDTGSESETVQTETKAEENLGGPAVEEQKASVESVKTSPKVSKKKTAKKST